MEITKLVVGSLKENCYIITEDDRVLVIDPGDNIPLIISKIEKFAPEKVAVLLTHGHFDHAMGAKAIFERGSKVYIHPLDAKKLTNKQNLSFILSQPFPYFSGCEDLVEGEMIINGFDILVIHTPGHTKGSVCFAIEHCLFTGDTIFADGSIGRTDLSDGNFNEIINSIDKLAPFLEKGFTILDGH
ncbi:MAG: MBL fold metallo-hydrolase [Clostridia bacterium]